MEDILPLIHDRNAFARRILICVFLLISSVVQLKAEAGYITLGTDQIQGNYSIQDDPTTDGVDIKSYITWANTSTDVPANNQISANGNFGSANSGLREISTTDSTHIRKSPTYSIGENSFNIQYAMGVVNVPGASDTFQFSFELPASIDQTTAQEVVDTLNNYISNLQNGTPLDASASPYVLQSNINGQVVFDGSEYKNFSNNPTVYVPNANVPCLESLNIFASCWAGSFDGLCELFDYTGDGIVDMSDFAIYSANWIGSSL